MDDVQIFLERFHEYDDIEDVFTRGCCYWFAIVLRERFEYTGPVIMYDEVMNHFGTEIGDRVYDITGDVTDRYRWTPWEELDDELLRERIVRDCVMF